MIFFLFNFYLINSLLSLLEKNYYVFYRLLNTKIIFNSIFKKITTTLYNYVNPFGGQSQHAVSSRFTYRGAKKRKRNTWKARYHGQKIKDIPIANFPLLEGWTRSNEPWKSSSTLPGHRCVSFDFIWDEEFSQW